MRHFLKQQRNKLRYNFIITISFVLFPAWTNKWPVLNVLSYFTAFNLAGGATTLPTLVAWPRLLSYHLQYLVSCYWEKHYWWDASEPWGNGTVWSLSWQCPLPRYEVIRIHKHSWQTEKNDCVLPLKSCLTPLLLLQINQSWKNLVSLSLIHTTSTDRTDATAPSLTIT